jgi:uncharacterized protein YqhQ
MGKDKKEKVRLGGMALANGVLVHGPTSWACAVRTDDGHVKVVARRKRLLGSKVKSPLLRGPARLAETFAFLPDVKRAVPEAQLPFTRGRVLRAMLGSAIVLNVVRRTRLSYAAKELLNGEKRTREHERCGTHLVGPLVVTATVGNVLAASVPLRFRPAARAAAGVGALAASTEIFSWMQRNPDHRFARALARPGYEFQHRVATAEPTRAQLEVAEAALNACLELEES